MLPAGRWDPMGTGSVRGALDEVGEHVVEVRMPLDGMAEALEHDSLGRELTLERVADPVEGRVVMPGHHELRKRRGSERPERDLRLPRAALHLERLRALLELR